MYPVHHKIYLGVTGIIFLSVGWFVNQFLQNKKLRSHEPAVVPGAKFDLTEREFEVLVLIARGYSNREIAEKLFLSLPTIKTHVSNLFTKLDVKRRTQAIKRARELKMIE